MMAKFARADSPASREKSSPWEFASGNAEGLLERLPSGDVQTVELTLLLYGVARWRSGIASTLQLS